MRMHIRAMRMHMHVADGLIRDPMRFEPQNTSPKRAQNEVHTFLPKAAGVAKGSGQVLGPGPGLLHADVAAAFDCGGVAKLQHDGARGRVEHRLRAAVDLEPMRTGMRCA